MAEEQSDGKFLQNAKFKSLMCQSDKGQILCLWDQR